MLPVTLNLAKHFLREHRKKTILCYLGGKQLMRKLASICTLLKCVVLETLNQKQELWGAQGLNFGSFSCPSSPSCPGAARQCCKLGARCLRGACGCLQVCCWLQEWLLCYLDGDFFYYFLNICCAFVYGKNYNPRRNCWLMYRWCQMRKSTVWHIPN